MSTILKLKAPNGSPIVGMRLNDGSSVPFECRFSRISGENTFFYKVPDGMVADLLTFNGQKVLVDSQGNEWPSGDVEFASAPPI
jgi:hypothetical protein